jgi:hypothetical protein
VPYAKVPHATIKARTIAAVPIVNQKSRWRPVPGAAFHDLLRCPVRCWMPRHFSVEDFSVGMPDHEEDVKRTAAHAWTESPGRTPKDRCETYARRVAPHLSYIELRATEDDEGQGANSLKISSKR